MSQIKNRNTKPEITVRKVLHRLGYRFRLHQSQLPGKPDIVLARHRAVIFVHGCYWHRHPGCNRAYTPKSNQEFWEAKFIKNIKHDKAVTNQLESMGWRQLVIWECQTKNRDLLEMVLIDFIEKKS